MNPNKQVTNSNNMGQVSQPEVVYRTTPINNMQFIPKIDNPGTPVINPPQISNNALLPNNSNQQFTPIPNIMGNSQVISPGTPTQQPLNIQYPVVQPVPNYTASQNMQQYNPQHQNNIPEQQNVIEIPIPSNIFPDEPYKEYNLQKKTPLTPNMTTSLPLQNMKTSGKNKQYNNPGNVYKNKFTFKPRDNKERSPLIIKKIYTLINSLDKCKNSSCIIRGEFNGIVLNYTCAYIHNMRSNYKTDDNLTIPDLNNYITNLTYITVSFLDEIVDYLQLGDLTDLIYLDMDPTFRSLLCQLSLAITYPLVLDYERIMSNKNRNKYEYKQPKTKKNTYNPNYNSNPNNQFLQNQ
jgi:hypothetical protein